MEDVVFTADVFLRETHPRFRVALQHVESITATDTNSVIVKLKNEFGPFLGMFEVGTMPIIPRHIYEGSSFRDNPANATPIGTGAFKFAEWEKGSYIKLVRNDDYYIDVHPGGSVENFNVPRLVEADNSCPTVQG